MCLDAVKSGVKIDKIFYTEEFLNKFSGKVIDILEFSDENFVVSKDVMKSISDTKSPQGILCICNFSEKRLNLEDELKRVILLDRIQNPSNLGAIIRTCNALGFDGIIISKDSCDIYNPKTLKSSMGSLFRVKILISNDLERTVYDLNKKGICSIAMVAERRAKKITEFKNLERIALVIGNEGNGISDKVKEACMYCSFIPMDEDSDSLNAAVASGIAMWEISK